MEQSQKMTSLEKRWVLYDVGNSAFTLLISTILPIYFNGLAGAAGLSDAEYLAFWGYAASFVTVVVAVLGPTLGAVADLPGMKKKLFVLCVAVGVAGCAVMGLLQSWVWFLGCFVIAKIGYSASLVFYDSMLTDVTTPERMDQVSTMGYGLGYIGGSTIPLLAFLIMNLVLGSDKMLFCLSFAFGLTAVWWFVFSLPLLKNVQQKSWQPRQKGAVALALKGLASTLREIRANKAMLVYLIAYFFYIDGVNTIIHMSTSYGDTLGLDSTSMLLALLLVQVLGLPFCLLYIKASSKFGARFMVGVGICIYMGITVFGFFLRSVWQFWVLAILVATSQGGIQALSRSMFGKMIPDKSRSGEFFGFYDIFGKFSAIMGPSLVGFTSALAADIALKNQGLTAETADPAVVEAVTAQAAPWGILSLMLIFFIGGGLYFFVLPRYLKKEGN